MQPISVCRRYKRRADTAVNIAFRSSLPPVVNCAYCHAAMLHEEVTIDHIVPLSRHGSTRLGNLAPACARCNSAKGNKMLPEMTIPHSRVVRKLIWGSLKSGGGFDSAWDRVTEEGLEVGELYFWEVARRVANEAGFFAFSGPYGVRVAGSRWGFGTTQVAMIRRRTPTPPVKAPKKNGHREGRVCRLCNEIGCECPPVGA